MSGHVMAQEVELQQWSGTTWRSYLGRSLAEAYAKLMEARRG